jgi:hypothetical protein
MQVNKSRKKSRKNYFCEFCDYVTVNKCDFDKHVTTAKHKINTDLGIFSIKNPKKSEILFRCECCDYNTSNKKDFAKHESTRKHEFHNKQEFIKKSPDHKCELCHKYFSNYNTLWKHKQKCQGEGEGVNSVATQSTVKDSEKGTNEMFISFMKQSTEFQQLLFEQNKDLQNTLLVQTNKVIELSKTQNVVNNTTNNMVNQQFNLQLFLNETCKDAMNIMDFVNSLQIQLEDFEATGKLGYIEGITRIIINGLNLIDTTKRPIHCTDVKRETLYIKHDDSWEKEEPEKTNLKTAVNQVARMNLRQLPKWVKENPASEILDTKENNEYVKYSMAALGGIGDEEENRFIDKIMKNVMKNVIVDKSKFEARRMCEALSEGERLDSVVTQSTVKESSD